MSRYTLLDLSESSVLDFESSTPEPIRGHSSAVHCRQKFRIFYRARGRGTLFFGNFIVRQPMIFLLRKVCGLRAIVRIGRSSSYGHSFGCESVNASSDTNGVSSRSAIEDQKVISQSDVDTSMQPTRWILASWSVSARY